MTYANILWRMAFTYMVLHVLNVDYFAAISRNGVRIVITFFILWCPMAIRIFLSFEKTISETCVFTNHRPNLYTCIDAQRFAIYICDKMYRHSTFWGTKYRYLYIIWIVWYSTNLNIYMVAIALYKMLRIATLTCFLIFRCYLDTYFSCWVILIQKFWICLLWNIT